MNLITYNFIFGLDCTYIFYFVLSKFTWLIKNYLYIYNFKCLFKYVEKIDIIIREWKQSLSIVLFHGKRLDRMGGCFILYLCWKYVINDYKSTTSITLIKHFISVVSKPVIDNVLVRSDNAPLRWLQRAKVLLTIDTNN